MASAGRILIMPKGNWKAETEYEMLDLVFHNGTSWLAKKNVVGIEPSDANSEYWHSVVNIDPSDVYNRLAALENQMISTLSFEEDGVLALGDGKGETYVTEYGAVLSAVKDEDNYRDLILGHPIMATNPNDFLKLANVVDGKLTHYIVFGEHNIQHLLNNITGKANGGTTQFTMNPAGNDYVTKTFDITNRSDLLFFANTVGINGVYVTGIIINAFTPNSATVTIHLNKAYDGELTFFVGWNKAIYE